MSDAPAEIEQLLAEKDKYEVAFRRERDARVSLETEKRLRIERQRNLDPGDEVGAYWVIPLVCLMIEFVVLMWYLWPTNWRGG